MALTIARRVGRVLTASILGTLAVIGAAATLSVVQEVTDAILHHVFLFLP